MVGGKETTCDDTKFYYSLLSLLSPVPLPPSTDSSTSMAPSRALRMKMSMCHDVNFILGWPVTWGRRDREALAQPTARRHCWALIGIWGVCVCFTMVIVSNASHLKTIVFRIWEHSIIHSIIYTSRQSVKLHTFCIRLSIISGSLAKGGGIACIGRKLVRVCSWMCTSLPWREISHSPSSSQAQKNHSLKL